MHTVTATANTGRSPKPKLVGARLALAVNSHASAVARESPAAIFRRFVTASSPFARLRSVVRRHERRPGKSGVQNHQRASLRTLRTPDVPGGHIGASRVRRRDPLLSDSPARRMRSVPLHAHRDGRGKAARRRWRHARCESAGPVKTTRQRLRGSCYASFARRGRTLRALRSRSTDEPTWRISDRRA